MAIQTTEAFVLSRRDIRETSILASFYSKDFGKIKGVLKGIRAERTRYGSLSELFSLNKIVFYEKIKSEFNNITQCDLMDGFPALRKDLNALASAAYIAELTEMLTEPNEKNSEIYDLLYQSFKFLSAQETAVKIVRIFEARLLACLGFSPMLENCVHCAGAITGTIRFSLIAGGLLCEKCLSYELDAVAINRGTLQTLKHLLSAGFDSSLKLTITNTTETELKNLIEGMLERHLDRPLKSKKFLMEIKRLAK